MSLCRDTRRRIGRAFDGSLSLDEELLVEQHAEHCAQCRSEWEATRALATSLANLPAPPVERLDLERSLRAIRSACTQDEVHEARSERPRHLLFRLGLPAAAAVLIGLGISTRRAAPAVEIGPVSVSETVLVQEDPSPAEVLDTGLDPLRLQEVRAALRTAFEEAAQDLPLDATREGAQQFALHFEALAREFLDADWPVERHVAGWVLDEDVDLARAAARYVGVRSDAAAAVLERALSRPAIKEAVARALCDAGAFAALAGVVWDAELTDVVLDATTQLDDTHGARWVRTAFQRAPRRAARAAPEREFQRGVARRLVDLLTHCGPPGARELLALSSEPLCAEADVIEALAQSPASHEVVSLRVDIGVAAADARFLLLVIARIHPESTFHWVEERCRSQTLAPYALGALAAFDGLEPLHSLLRMRGVREHEGALHGAWRRLLERDATRFEELARQLIQRSDLTSARRMIELSVLTRSPAAVPALLTLSSTELLPDDDRERALLAVGELGQADQAPLLLEVFERLTSSDAALAAACVATTHSLGGAAAVEDLLEDAPERVRLRVLASLESVRPGSTLTLYKLARELDSMLALREVTRNVP